MEIKHALPRSLETFGLVEREEVAGKKLTNQCGRDFFYFVLNYYFPERHNPKEGNPRQITEAGTFGSSWLPVGFIWTGLTFRKIPAYLKNLGLVFTINNRVV